MNIGVFDSGLGGLSVLKHIALLLPEYSYVYLGDNARAPYGDRSDDYIYECTRQGVEFLFQQNCAVVILACNTASTSALRRLQQEWLPSRYPDRRILGVIIPVVEKLAALKGARKTGIIGTRATVASGAYATECAKRGASHIQLVMKACPLLVPIIEEGWEKTIIARKTLRKYLSSLKEARIDTLILACTHYAFMKKMIQSLVGSRLRIIDPGPIVAASLKDYLARHGEIAGRLSNTPSITCHTTDSSGRAQYLASRFWRKPITIALARIDEL